MRAALARIESLEGKLGTIPASPAARRIRLARRLYQGHAAALRRLLSAPSDPAAVGEFQLDQLLLAPAAADSVRELDLDGHPVHEPLDAGPGGLTIPAHDERYEDEASGDRPELIPGHVWLPPGRLHEPLKVHGERPPGSWQEAAWLAGTSGDGLYLGVIDGEARALRSRGGEVEARGFGQAWRSVGTVEKKGR